MLYVITDTQGAGDGVLCGQVRPQDESYLRNVIIPSMRPLTEEAYLNGPHAILLTAARSSYILENTDVYWCIEWNPAYS